MIERIEQIVAPGYADGLDGRDVDALRAMKSEATAIENSVSYYRRLAQGRIEILEAEQDRRVTGGSVADLIERLPQILGNEPARPAAANSRLVEPDVEIASLEWRDGREHLVTGDSSLAALPVLADGELRRVLDELRSFEKELSGYRQRLHGVIDTVEREIATRRRRRLTARPTMDEPLAQEGDADPLHALEERARDLGGFIRDQRRNARLSLRKLSEAAGISNPYLSQIERGLRKPSAEILQGIARGLRISAETLYERAGLLSERGEGPDLVDEILRDTTITERQKDALVSIYRSFQAETAAQRVEAPNPPPGS